MAIGKLPCDRLYPGSFGARQGLTVAAAVFASGCLSIEVDVPVLELGASRAQTHRPVPLDPKAQHRRLPANNLHPPKLARAHTL
jgi:hypothetical protein